MVDELTLQLPVVEERKLVDDLVDFLASAQTNKNLKTFKRKKYVTCALFQADDTIMEC